VKNLTEQSGKPLSPAMRSDRLWSKIKAKAVDLGHGRLSIEFVVRSGHVVKADVVGQRESLVAD